MTPPPVPSGGAGFSRIPRLGVTMPCLVHLVAVGAAPVHRVLGRLRAVGAPVLALSAAAARGGSSPNRALRRSV